MNLAQAAHHGFVRLRVVLDAEARILGCDLVQDVGHFLLVAALSGLHREAEHGGGQLERPGVDMRVGGRVVKDVVELDLLDLGDGADVTRNGFVDFGLRLAAQHEEVPCLDRLPSLSDIELGARSEPALMHAKHRQPPDVGVDLDLEYMSKNVPAGVRNGLQVGRRAAARRRADIGRRISFGRIRQQLDDDLEKLLDAGAGPRGCEDDRNEVAFAQRALEGLVQFLGRDLAFLQVPLHQLLVDLDHLVDELAVRLLHRGEIRFARGREEAVRNLAAVCRRKVERQAFLAEALLDALEQRLQVDVLGIDLVDHDEPIEPALRRPLHEAAGHHLDAVLRVDHDRCGFHRREGGQCVAEEIGIPGRVEKVDARRLAVGFRLEARHRELQGMLQLLLQGGVIADGSAALYAAGRGDHPRGCEQRFGQAGLSRPRLADERNRPEMLDGICQGPASSIRVRFIAATRVAREALLLAGVFLFEQVFALL